MTAERLHVLLQQLHDELSRVQSLDEPTRDQLRELADDLHNAASADATQTERLRVRLEEQIERFEASHPTVAQALANLIDALALYGL